MDKILSFIISDLVNPSNNDLLHHNDGGDLQKCKSSRGLHTLFPFIKTSVCVILTRI